MRRTSIDDDMMRLVCAAQRIVRLARDIGERAQQDREQSPAAVPTGDPLSGSSLDLLFQASRDAAAAHGRLPDFGAPSIFRNPIWLLMLELFSARLGGTTVSVKAASLTLGGAPSTANRTILELERLDLICSASDETDARRRLLALTPRAEAILRNYLSQQIERREPSLRMSIRVAHQDLHENSHEIESRNHPVSDRSICGSETVLQ